MLLPADSQQRLVQLLYFLPKMPQPLLANLSCCCTAGRISASLAASLIRIVHLRYALSPSTHTHIPAPAETTLTLGACTLICSHQMAVVHFCNHFVFFSAFIWVSHQHYYIINIFLRREKNINCIFCS